MSRSFLFRPFALALLVTAANILKPVTVDDTAYLTYARQIAHHPFDPYGFTAFWWAEPEPAMHILIPPVVPYWLACGMQLFGESPALLKLWLLPFLYLLAWSLRSLLFRFARGTEWFVFPLLMLSPAVLPTVNLMIDVPAFALALTAIEVFIRSTRQRNLRQTVLAGVLAGLAMQTKYTALIVPVVIAWYGLTHRLFVLTAVAIGISIALFAGWESLLVLQYHETHFLYHASQSAGAPPPGASRVTAFFADKSDLIPPLAGQLGCVAVGVGLLAASVLRFSRRWLAGVAVGWSICFVLVCLLPRRMTVMNAELTATTAFWQTSGGCWLAAIAGCGATLLFRMKKGLGIRFSADSWFLVGWLAIELAASLVLSPFPAARRVIGITVVGGLVAARAASRIQRAYPERKPPQWILAVGIAAGVSVAAIDTLDAFPEKVCAERAAEITHDRPETTTVWFVGHWGFQYYCERAGMKSLVLGKSVLQVGDFLVLPAYPDAGFFRPYAGFDVQTPPAPVAEEIAVVQWDDWLSAQTVPNFYGGTDPIAGRGYARLQVRVYRLRTDWIMR